MRAAGLMGDDYIEGSIRPSCWVWFGRPIAFLMLFIGALALALYLTSELASDKCGSNRTVKQLEAAGCNTDR